MKINRGLLIITLLSLTLIQVSLTKPVQESLAGLDENICLLVCWECFNGSNEQVYTNLIFLIKIIQIVNKI